MSGFVVNSGSVSINKIDIDLDTVEITYDVTNVPFLDDRKLQFIVTYSRDTIMNVISGIVERKPIPSQIVHVNLFDASVFCEMYVDTISKSHQVTLTYTNDCSIHFDLASSINGFSRWVNWITACGGIMNICRCDDVGQSILFEGLADTIRITGEQFDRIQQYAQILVSRDYFDLDFLRETFHCDDERYDVYCNMDLSLKQINCTVIYKPTNVRYHTVITISDFVKLFRLQPTEWM